MRNGVLKFGLIALGFVLIVGCEKDNEEVLVDVSNVEETVIAAKADNSAEALSDMVLQAYEAEEAQVKSAMHPYFPDCATVTVERTDTTKTVTVDFGTEGCEVRGGHIVKGKLIITYEINVDELSKTITYNLVDFFIDDAQIAGSKTIVRQRENANGNPQYTMNLELEITFSDGAQVSRTGNKTREWIEGAFNGNWGDNVFQITGAWQTTFVNGNVHSTTITTPLRREASCRFLVSGVLEIVRTNFSGSLDYGDGTCDNLALFTNAAGEQREIRL